MSNDGTVNECGLSVSAFSPDEIFFQLDGRS